MSTARVFVFGSNLAGIHGAGAAKDALKKHGAEWGKGVGHHGNSYAIPTKDRLLGVIPLHLVRPHIQRFLEYAKAHPEIEFDVTRIGCGLAGYKDADIAPMFEGAPANCHLPKAWGGDGFDW